MENRSRWRGAMGAACAPSLWAQAAFQVPANAERPAGALADPSSFRSKGGGPYRGNGGAGAGGRAAARLVPRLELQRLAGQRGRAFAARRKYRNWVVARPETGRKGSIPEARPAASFASRSFSAAGSE